MNFLQICFRKYILTIFILLISFNSIAQNILEESLGAVVTVGIFNSGTTKKSFGFRGAPSDMAYAKMLDLSGASACGSGFIVKFQGKLYILTNAHVVENAYDKEGSIYVYTINRSKYKVKIVGGDSFYDFAVLEFIDSPGSEVSYLNFRDLPAWLGEPVYAIGNPLGEYPYTVTQGIISAKNRVRGGLTGKFGFLQTTATVIWGNSGGPLIDKDGKVLGMNSQIAFATQNGTTIWQPQINFALETNILRRLFSDIVSNDGIIKRAFFGLELSKKQIAYKPGTSEYIYASKQYNLDSFPIISNVASNAPASVLKNYEGWQVIAINNESIRNIEEALGELEKARPGEKVIFTVFKDAVKNNVAVIPSNLDKNTSEIIGRLLMLKAAATYNESQEKMYVHFQDVASPNHGMYSNVNKKQTGDVYLGNQDWQLLAVGVLEDDFNSLYRVNDIIDAGTAARLTGLSGVVDLILFRKGSDPDAKENYVKKRINLSGDDQLVQPTLWY